MRASAASGLVALFAAMTLLVGCGGADSSKPSQADMTTMAEKPPTVEHTPVEQTPMLPPMPPGVSSLSYSPKRISKDMTEMAVRFSTTAPAGPGLEYTAWLFAGEDARDQQCYSEFGPVDAVPGEVGKTYEQVIHLVAEGQHACMGRARLLVWIQERSNPGVPLGGVAYRETSFEILPAR